MPARAWGLTDKTPKERIEKALNAGVDQFGGEAVPQIIIELVNEGKISEARIDSSVRRLLRMKFVQGLFDNPFIDVEKAVLTVGNEEFMAAGEMAQRRSMVLLKNDTIEGKAVLPLKKGVKVYIENIDPAIASSYCTVVKKPGDADFAIIRLKSPRQHLKGTGLLGMMFGSGDLDFKEKEKKEILEILEKVPSVVDIYFERPPVIPEIEAVSKGLLVNFGANDKVLLDIIFGDFNPSGKLPVEIPSSMEAVRKQKEDVPHDSENPLFPFGFGLSYRKL
jgi:beta-glucosidase